MHYAIHLNAGNDRNGNPRRAYLIYDVTGAYVGSVNEGYQGAGAIEASGLLPGGATVTVLAQVPTTPRYYNDALRSEK